MSLSCAVSYFLQVYGPTHDCTGRPLVIVFRYNRTAAVVFGGQTAGTADTPMAFLCGWGAYEVTWLS